MSYILKCLFIIIGTLIGAGFASGQEILTFFNRYGDNGLYGMILSGIFFGIVIFITLYISEKKKIEEYDELILNSKILRCIFEIFLFICFCIMVAGCGAFFEQQFKLPFWLGSVICSLTCYGIFSCKYKGLETVNTLLVPFILIGIFMLGAGEYEGGAITNTSYKLPESYTSSWFVSSVLYASYNSIILVPILLTFKEYKLTFVKKVFISIFSTIVFLSIGILMYNILNIYYPNILAFELPNVKLASLIGKFQTIFYGIVIVTAIITTAVSSGYAFLEMRKKHYNIKAVVLCIVAVLFSRVGFSELVNTVFPIFGYLGLLQIICIIIVGFKKQKE
ncbi:MAG: hypothetical protein J6B87_02685 [Clostridia bacterium]|nr:hypothetical protein [Clostridia bacterium]